MALFSGFSEPCGLLHNAARGAPPIARIHLVTTEPRPERLVRYSVRTATLRSAYLTGRTGMGRSRTFSVSLNATPSRLALGLMLPLSLGP